MLQAWRLLKTRYLATAWDGTGAKRAGGRWNSVGVPVVYTSASLSLALVEVLVHLPSGILPAYSAVPVEFEERLVTVLPQRSLPKNWRAEPAPSETRALGDAWAAAKESAVLRVPSVVVPNEFNYLLNPAHPDFTRLKVGKPVAFPFDPRLRSER
jgi:RES domain-containing protein